jgi:hypothetical protein
MSIRTEARFPPITGETLTGRTFQLPEDFEEPLNLVFVAFRRAQQADVDSWLPVAADIEASFPDVRYYELPVMSRLYAAAKPFIDGGMRAGIPDVDTRERTITVYTDKKTVRRALDIEDESEIHAFLLDRDGVIYWRAAGPHDEDNAEHLHEIVDSLS